MILVVLVEFEGLVNIGMIVRMMKNFGFLRLVFINLNLIEESYVYVVYVWDVFENVLILDLFEKVFEFFDFIVGMIGKFGKCFILYRVLLMFWELVGFIKDYFGEVGIFFGCESIGLKNEEFDVMDVIFMIFMSEEYFVMNFV